MTAPKFDQPPADPDGALTNSEPADVERVGEVRFHPVADPPPATIELGDLPSSYGTKRLVLLPVDPYLIHVYWELDSTAPPAARVRPILRFYESPTSSDIAGRTLQSRPFDVDVDFTTSSWYVNLWSPDKTYYAELGWRGEDGSFLPLVRSNSVLTPAAWPRAAAAVATGESVPAREEELSQADLATVEAPAPSDSVALPTTTATPVVATTPPPSKAPPSKADEFLQRRMAELFDIRGELPPVHAPVELPYEFDEDIPGEPSQLDAPLPAPWSGLEEMDLTQISEERFTPGISSEWKSLGE